MADSEAKPKRKVRPAPTVREQTEEAAKPKTQGRRVRATAAASKPIRATGSAIGRGLRPFRFLLAPFHNRPMRFIGRKLYIITGARYFRNSWKELKLVTWPNRKQTAQLTFAVFVFAAVFGILVTITDYGLDKIFKRILLK
ncbi:MAG TPA: preprotein translocase subunit SecE [Patescibacteria group bacterium]|nr:preprotein translocase subunit SecE [Patescibacteria group bacterium]